MIEYNVPVHGGSNLLVISGSDGGLTIAMTTNPVMLGMTSGTAQITTINANTILLNGVNIATLLPRAWVCFDGIGSASIKSQVGISSIVRNSVGRYSVNFLSALPNTNYGVLISCESVTDNGTAANIDEGAGGKSTTGVKVMTYKEGSFTDSKAITVMIMAL